MYSLRFLLAAAASLSAAIASGATLHLEPYAPASPQSTCQYCFFAEPVAVFVRDESGATWSGVDVVFSAPAPANAFIPNVAPGPYTVRSDSNGIARVPAPGFVTSAPGSFTVTATSPMATGSITFDLTATASRPSRIDNIAMPPITVVDTPFADHFVVRAVDADGRQMPNVALIFVSSPGNAPAGSFQPGDVSVAFAQANGLGDARAPTFVANGFVGQGEVLATTFDPAVAPIHLPFFNSAAGAASIEPIAGASPQSARLGAVFPAPVGALVRDGAGNPLRDAAVRFLVSFPQGAGYGVFLTQPATTQLLVLYTGADGRAIAPVPLMAASAGALALAAQVPGDNLTVLTTSYALTAVAGAPSRLDILAGNSQRAIVNTTYAQPWIVRATGDDGLAVPYAAIYFYSEVLAGAPGVSFAGQTRLYVVADANGVATSPPVVANAVVGSNFGSASGFSTDMNRPSPFAQFTYENVSTALDAGFVGLAANNNAPVGGKTWAPFRVLVTNRLGLPVANAAYTYQADSTCGRFLGQPMFHGFTDANGYAVSPLFEGTAPSLACGVGFQVEGLAAGIGTTVHTFDPRNIVFGLVFESLALTTQVEQWFGGVVRADGLAVYYPVTAEITADKNGASAALEYLTQDPGVPNFTGAIFTNTKSGSYAIILRAGPVSATIPVSQKQH